MKKLTVLIISTFLILVSCAPNGKEDEVVQKKDEAAKQDLSIVPSYQLSKDNYKMILPYRPSEARGVIVNQLANRVDIDEMEEGLRRQSKEVFDPEKYLFEEGQYLTKDMVYEWLGRQPTKEQLEREFQAEVSRLEKAKMTVNEEKIREELQQGLNPPIELKESENELTKDEKKYNEKEQRKSPKYLSHILEQNFLKKKEDNTVELVGISIGIALKSVYQFQTETGEPYYYEKISKEDMLKEGNEVAKKVLERIRKMDAIKDVSVMIALYREEDQASPVPGNFVAKTTVSGGDTKVGKWEDIKEEYILFPSSGAKKKYHDDYQIVKSFSEDISQYFPNYVGVVGEGFYMNKELKKLSIEIPIEFYGKGEILGFTQYAYGLVKKMFPNYYDLEIKVMSSDKMESLIYREAGTEDPVVHIFH